MPIGHFQSKVKVQRLNDQSAHFLSRTIFCYEDENSGINKYHHDTTILFSLDSCYMFAHKRNYLVVVSFLLQLESMLIMLRQTDCTESAGDQSSVRMDKQI